MRKQWIYHLAQAVLQPLSTVLFDTAPSLYTVQEQLIHVGCRILSMNIVIANSISTVIATIIFITDQRASRFSLLMFSYKTVYYILSMLVRAIIRGYKYHHSKIQIWFHIVSDQPIHM